MTRPAAFTMTLVVGLLVPLAQGQEFGIPDAAFTAAPEIATVQTATTVLNQIMVIPASSIPSKMLQEAEAVAIVPNVIKGGFVVGIRHGKGVVLTKDEQGHWTPPTFVSLTGGSIGWQAGVQATDVILVFKTRQSVQNLLNGKFTIGADAAAAAGPVGRQAAAATDAQLKAEILSYSRSRGLFAGVSLDGSAIQIDQEANNRYYAGSGIAPGGAVIPGQPVQWPPSAVQLVEAIMAYSQGPAAAQAVPQAAPAIPLPAGQPVANIDVNAMRQELGDASQQLSPFLDETWRKYLGLTGVFTAEGGVNVDAMKAVLGRFDTVARNPQYAALTSRPEFKAMYESLRRSHGLLARTANAQISLPPPPGQ